MSARVHDEAGGRWIPLVFVGALAVLIVVQACFAYLAASSDPGLAAPNAYERGLAHNAVLREAATERARGWRIAIENVADAADAETHRGRLIITVSDAGARRLDDLQVIGLAVRPTRAGLDHHLAFDPIGGGRYRADYDLPLPGVWQLDLLVDRAGATVQHSSRFSAP